MPSQETDKKSKASIKKAANYINDHILIDDLLTSQGQREQFPNSNNFRKVMTYKRHHRPIQPPNATS